MFKKEIKAIKDKLSAGMMALVPTCPATGCGKAELFELFRRLISFGIILGGLVIGIAIIYGGFLVLTSGGDEQKVSQGRSAIWHAIVGFTIVLSAWLIVNTILTISGCEGAWYLLDGSSFRCQ